LERIFYQNWSVFSTKIGTGTNIQLIQVKPKLEQQQTSKWYKSNQSWNNANYKIGTSQTKVGTTPTIRLVQVKPKCEQRELQNWYIGKPKLKQHYWKRVERIVPQLIEPLLVIFLVVHAYWSFGGSGFERHDHSIAS
jgi:hypothetical protein